MLIRGRKNDTHHKNPMTLRYSIPGKIIPACLETLSQEVHHIRQELDTKGFASEYASLMLPTTKRYLDESTALFE